LRGQEQDLGITLIKTDNFGRDYPARNPEWVFPPVKKQATMYGKRQQKTVKDGAKSLGCEAILWGRRVQENTVREDIYTTMDFILHCHPLKDWKHTHIWNYIYEHGLSYSSIYEHRIGELFGFTPWNFMTPDWLGDGEDCWKMIADYDPLTIKELSQWFPEAQEVCDA